jgi:hypothetical protein
MDNIEQTIIVAVGVFATYYVGMWVGYRRAKRKRSEKEDKP